MIAPEEKAAMEWLEVVERGGRYPVADILRAQTLKAMLARPVMPEEPTQGALDAMWRGVAKGHGVGISFDTFVTTYRALYAHLNKPQTKTVWRVSGVWSDGSAASPADFNTLQQAVAAGCSWHQEGCHSMAITQTTVPA